MELKGDPTAVAVLKAKHAKDKDYVKFLVTEARSNVDHTATFSGDDGQHYRLTFDAVTGALDVQPLGGR